MNDNQLRGLPADLDLLIQSCESIIRNVKHDCTINLAKRTDNMGAILERVKEQYNTAFDQPEPKETNLKLFKQSATIECLVKENKQLAAENTTLRTSRFKRFNDEECWIWQGGGEDYLESLVCPVVISARDLMEIIRTPLKHHEEDRSMAVHRLREMDVDVVLREDHVYVQATLMDGVLYDFVDLVEHSAKLGEDS